MSDVYSKVNIPVGSVGGARVERIGGYTHLFNPDGEWMNDTPFMLQTSEPAYQHAHGHVLLAGLGLGAILPAILAKPEVESVTVLEWDSDVIALVGPHYSHPKLTIMQGDAMRWVPPQGRVFNCMWFDFIRVEPPILWLLDSLVAHYSQWLDKDDPDAFCDHALRAETIGGIL